MKRFLFAFIFVFCIGLFGTSQLNHTFAACIPNGGTCFVPVGDLCCSKSCVWQPPRLPGHGNCEPARKDPVPPCAPGALKDGKCTSVVTAFGTIKVDPGEFIARLFGILLGASGAIAVILIMRAGFQIMTARGNPEGIKEGREKIVAAIVGLMFLIFSFVILEVIGVDLLRLPNSTSNNTPVTKKLPPEKTCSTIGGACIPRGACTPDDGTSDGTRGCKTGTICCKPK